MAKRGTRSASVVGSRDRPSPARVKGRALISVNPATGETLATYEPLDDAQVDAKLANAAAAFRLHRRTSFAERARLLIRVAEILEGEREALGRLMTLEMGKPARAAAEEAAKCAWACRFYAEHAEAILADEPVPTNAATQSFIRYQPMGPVLAIMPWNLPFWQVCRFAAPALNIKTIWIDGAARRDPSWTE